jgi:hypothetical protein
MRVILKLFISGSILCLVLSSCSSPESDGKKVADKFCDCEKEFTEYLNEETQDFINNFDNYGFTSRSEARKKSEELINKASNEYKNCIEKVQQKYSKFKGKYVGNFEKMTKFEYAFNEKMAFNEQEIKHTVSNQMEVNNLILTIIPPKPDIEKIKQNLIGRKITEQPNGYHRQGWYWEIKEGEIKELQIITESKQSNDYLFEIRMILQAEGSAHEAFVNLTYVLGQNDDWTIDFLESKQVNIVKTGQYNNCITVQRKGWSGEFELEFTNHCDVALVVGGVILSEFGGEWIKFSTVVDASGIGSVGGLFSVSVRDYRIHFIERP